MDIVPAIQAVYAAGRDVKINKKKCERFLLRVLTAEPSVRRAATAATLPATKSDALAQLQVLFIEAATFMNAFKQRSWARRAFNHATDRESFVSFNDRLSQLLQLLQVDMGTQAAQWASENASDIRDDNAAMICALDETIHTGMTGIEESLRAEFAQLKLDLSPSDPGAGVALAPLLISFQFDGKKKSEARLGKGAFGVTYRMKNKLDHALYAAKMVNLADAKDHGIDMVSMKREARALLSLNHKNIIRYFGSFLYEREVEDEPVREYCIVMELAPGGTLADLCQDLAKREVPLAEERVCEIAAQLCSALHHMHREVRMIHRDLKPRNVLLSASGQVKICDLGLSCMVMTGISLSKLKRGRQPTCPQRRGGADHTERRTISGHWAASSSSSRHWCHWKVRLLLASSTPMTRFQACLKRRRPPGIRGASVLRGTCWPLMPLRAPRLPQPFGC